MTIVGNLLKKKREKTNESIAEGSGKKKRGNGGGRLER